MALRIIEGVPGSGKSFYAVHHVAKIYFKYNKGLDLYEQVKDCTIITNIDSFKPRHLNLKKEISDAGSVAKFFSYDYQEQYKEGKPPLVYIIDEAQRFFRKGDKGLNDVYSYFEYHRHWGQDIYLVTQNVRKLPPDIVYLPEYVIKALPRVRSMMGEFKYHWISEREVIKRESVRPDQAVFALYKSMDVTEQEKIKNPVMVTVGKALLFSVVVLYGGYHYIMSRWSPSEPSPDSSVSSESASPLSLGDGIIPIGGKRDEEPPPRRYYVFQPLISIVRGQRVLLYSALTYAYIPIEEYPYKVLYKGGKWYAVYDMEHFSVLYPDEEERPRDVFILPEDSV